MAIPVRRTLLPLALVLQLVSLQLVSTQKLASRDDAFIGYSEKRADCNDKERCGDMQYCRLRFSTGSGIISCRLSLRCPERCKLSSPQHLASYGLVITNSTLLCFELHGTVAVGAGRMQKNAF